MTDAQLVTFYTADSPYERDAALLRESAHALGLEVHAEAVAGDSTWEGNCNLKADFCRRMVHQFAPRPVLFLDADCRLRQPPPQLNGTADLRLQVVRPDQLRPGWLCQRYRYAIQRRGGMWNSGVMLLRPTETMFRLLDAWVAWCGRRPAEWDQLNLQAAAVHDCPGVVCEPLPDDCRAGGPFIGHESARHRHWPQRASRRDVLLLGSAPDATEWWARHGAAYIDEGYAVVAVNNAWRVPGQWLDLWLKPNDYRDSAGEAPPPDVPRNEGLTGPGINRYGNWRISPWWHPGDVQLSLIDALFHLLNEAVADRVGLTVHVAGADMIYPPAGSGRPSHFYGTGAPDPERYTDAQLARALGGVDQAYMVAGAELYNASDQKQTRLPFWIRHLAGGRQWQVA